MLFFVLCRFPKPRSMAKALRTFVTSFRLVCASLCLSVWFPIFAMLCVVCLSLCVSFSSPHVVVALLCIIVQTSTTTTLTTACTQTPLPSWPCDSPSRPRTFSANNVTPQSHSRLCLFPWVVIYIICSASFRSLFLALCLLCNQSKATPAWTDIANRIPILFDSRLNIHPEFAGYNGDRIKQADVVLLAFPLGGTRLCLFLWVCLLLFLLCILLCLCV